MFSKTVSYQLTLHRLVPSLKLLILLFMLCMTWPRPPADALAATPLEAKGMSLTQLAQTTPLTTPTSLTTTPAGSVCPVGEVSWLAEYQGYLLEKLTQTTTGLAETLPTGFQFQERVNILLLGSDSRPGEKFGRTDTMILVTVDPSAKTAGMLSIPRDLWVSIPGYGENRINMAHRLGGVKEHPGGGPVLAMETVAVNLGVTIDYYVLVDFSGFEQVVDTLGGVEICVPEAIDAATYYGYTAEYVKPEEYYSFVAESTVTGVMDADNPAATETGESNLESGYQFLYIEPGLHTLDGPTALTYARSRASVTADFARVQRQQAVLMAIKDKALQAGVITQLPQLWQQVGQSVQTNLSLTEALLLAQLAYQIEPANIQTAAISHTQTLSYRTKEGAAVLLPRRVEMMALVESMFGVVQPTVLPTQAEVETGLIAVETINVAQVETN